MTDPQKPKNWMILGAVIVALAALNAWMTLRSFQVSEQLADRLDQSDTQRLFWLICHDGGSDGDRTSAFLKLLSAGNTEWKSARLNRLQLGRAELSKLQLEWVTFKDCDFRQADLKQANLKRCSFELSKLNECDFTGSELIECGFLKSDLNEAILREANLRGASFEQAEAKNATLVLADLSGAKLLMADFTGANLTGARMTGTNLEGAIFRKANLSLVRFQDTNVEEADLTNSNWWRSSGLTPNQLKILATKFAPNKDADPNWIKDFALWLETQTGSK